MDCEKFDQHVIEALYDELDELTDAALRRHVDGCTRCAQIFSQLKDAREVAAMPLVEPSAGLEERILAAEKAAVRRAPLHNKVIRGIAWAGSLAMRPQLAMAALFMLIVGSSLLLLRGKPNAASPTQVTQRGEPGESESSTDEKPMRAKTESKAASKADNQAPAARPRTLSADDSMPGALSTAAPPAPAAMPTEEADVAGSASAGNLKDELAQAESLKGDAGCGAALGKFQGIVERAPNSPEGLIAKSEIAKCKPLPASPAKPPGTATASSLPRK